MKKIVLLVMIATLPMTGCHETRPPITEEENKIFAESFKKASDGNEKLAKDLEGIYNDLPIK